MIVENIGQSLDGRDCKVMIPVEAPFDHHVKVLETTFRVFQDKDTSC